MTFVGFSELTQINKVSPLGASEETSSLSDDSDEGVSGVLM